MSNCEISDSDMKLIREFVDVFWATINANEDIVSSEVRVFVAGRLYKRSAIITSSPVRYVRSASCRFYERRENIAAYQRQPFFESGEFDIDPTPVIFIDCHPEANWAHKCIYVVARQLYTLRGKPVLEVDYRVDEWPPHSDMKFVELLNRGVE